MNKEKINKEKIITKQELEKIIGKEIDARIKSDDIDRNALVEIANELKKKGVPAGDERRTGALETLRQQMINKELEKRSI